MAIVPYCVVSETAQVNVPETGVGNADVLEVDVGSLICFYSEVDGIPQQTDAIRAMALQFRNVVQTLFATATAIPFRFVTLLRGEEELRRFLMEHEEKFTKALERLDGCAQFEIHLTRKGPAPEPEETMSGAEYLKGKKAAADIFETTSQMLDKRAGETALKWHFKPGDDDARCYALVQRAKLEEFKKALSGVELPAELRVVMSGPWPPSEFVE